MNILHDLDAKVRQQVVLASTAFPKTETINNFNLTVEQRYDSTVSSFKRAVHAVRHDACLKSLPTYTTIVETLETLLEGPLFLDLNLDQVDAVIIQRLGRVVLRLTNTNTNNRESRRVLLLELTEVQSRAADARCRFNIEHVRTDRGISWGLLAISLALGANALPAMPKPK